MIIHGLLVILVHATPINSQPLSRRQEPQTSLQSNDDSNHISARIWIPILVIALVLSCIAILTWSKRTLRRGLAGLSTAAADAPGSTASVGAAREVTAEQLAGTTGQTNGATTERPRRARRNRRTPSQISTTSLPAYMKEPGDQELVIFRGAQDMEDVDITAATNIVMPPVHEDESSVHSRDNSEASRYTLEPVSPHDMPLLSNEGNDSDSDLSDQPRAPPGEGMPTHGRTSILDTAEETNIVRTQSRPENTDPRGEAPPYFEVVNLNDIPPDSAPSRVLYSPPNTSSSRDTSSPPSSSGAPASRRSAFLSLWYSLGNARTSTSSSDPQGTTRHVRVDSGPSVASIDSQTGRNHHRPSPSGSSSILSSFRPLSRPKSTHTLNSTHNLSSPSLISLNSISAPLTHTLVRTEITYPKAGPTPEQVKLISSRESFARFGRPYGADAIAFAASASRQNLEPPPDFDSLNLGAPVPRSATSAGPSRLRSESTASAWDRSDSPIDSTPESSPDLSSGHTSSLAPAPPASQTQSPAAAHADASSSSPPAEPASAAASAPPTSFRAPVVQMRPESRASSVQTFATAAESLPPRTSVPDSGSDFESASDNEAEPESSATPKLNATRHLHMSTDTTITYVGTSNVIPN